MSEIAFEKIKHINEFDNEFWYARELGVALEYASFDKFKNVITKTAELTRIIIFPKWEK